MIVAVGRTFLMALLVCLVLTSPLTAQDHDYIIGTGDVLSLSVFSNPDWDRMLTLRGDGTVTVPQVGEIFLAGMTIGEAREVVARKVRLFDPSTGEISLAIEVYNSLRIHVLGAVATPGAYSFPGAPTIWEAVRAAGGPVEGSSLNRVQVIPAESAFGDARTYNLLDTGGSGSGSQLRLQSGDTVVVPGSDTAISVSPESGVQVFGHVATPGIVPLVGPSRLLTVLMMAGAPLVTSEMDKVFWVHTEANGEIRASRVNLDLFLKEGKLAGNPLVYPGDTLHMEGSQDGWVRRNLPMLLGVATATATVLLAMDRMQN